MKMGLVVAAVVMVTFGSCGPDSTDVMPGRNFNNPIDPNCDGSACPTKTTSPQSTATATSTNTSASGGTASGVVPCGADENSVQSILGTPVDTEQLSGGKTELVYGGGLESTSGACNVVFTNNVMTGSVGCVASRFACPMAEE